MSVSFFSGPTLSNWVSGQYYGLSSSPASSSSFSAWELSALFCCCRRQWCPIEHRSEQASFYLCLHVLTILVQFPHCIFMSPGLLHDSYWRARSALSVHSAGFIVVPLPDFRSGGWWIFWSHTEHSVGIVLPYIKGEVSKTQILIYQLHVVLFFLCFFVCFGFFTVNLFFCLQLLGLYNQWMSFLEAVRVFLKGEVSVQLPC